MTMSNWRSVVSSTDVRVSMPALLTMASRRPKAATVLSTRFWISAMLDTSPWTIWPLPPAASMALSVASAEAWSL